jgi:hypothetical protein
MDDRLDAREGAESGGDTPADQDRARPIPVRDGPKGVPDPAPPIDAANPRRGPAPRPGDESAAVPQLEVRPTDVPSEGSATLRFTARRVEWVARAVGLGSSGRPPGGHAPLVLVTFSLAEREEEPLLEILRVGRDLSSVSEDELQELLERARPYVRAPQRATIFAETRGGKKDR